MTFRRAAVLFSLILMSCTAEKANPEIEALTRQFQKAIESQKDLEAKIKQLGDADPGKAGFLNQDLELLKSRILVIKERGKLLNDGKDSFPEKATETGGSVH